MNSRRHRILAAALLTLLFTATIAAAEGEPSSDEYVARLEAICKPGALETQRVTRGVRSDLQAERLTVAAHKFSRSAQIFGATVRRISTVPRPPDEGSTLAKWFVYLGQQEVYLREIAAALRDERIASSQRLTARFVHNGNLANRSVLAFGFDYCSFDATRFG